jgi:hypothetical protein
MKKLLKNSLFLSAIVFVLVVLWQMLSPGYILTLDMAFTPKLSLAFADGAFYNAWPVKYLFGFLNLFLSGWIVQKIMLVVLFFSLFYLAAKFLPVPKSHYANYWAALFFSLNPFVYERFLAGHWTHLFAYAFLPPFFHYLLEFFKEYSYKKLGGLLLWTILIGMFSLHFLVMAVLIIAGCFLFKFISLGLKYFKDKTGKRGLLQVGKYALIFGGLFLIISSYWLVPYLNNRSASLLNTFGTDNQLAFKTAGNNDAETIFNVLTLYGFWGESEPWAGYFLWPKDNLIFWSVILGLLAIIIGLGIRYALKNRKREAWFFLGIGIIAAILACWLGESPFKGFNAWLFNNIGFWRGFRDTQKFSGLLALAYAYFGSFGFMAISEYIFSKRPKFSQAALTVMFLVPVFYTYTIIDGFARQLQPVWYPEAWYQVKEVLGKDTGDSQVLFLPWHQYLSLDFNHNLITANPAKSFFGTRVIQGDNMEVGGVFSQSQNIANLEMQNIILDKKTPDEAATALKDKNIRYILVMNRIIAEDYLKYPVLASDYLELAYNNEDHNGGLTLYRIK